MVKIKFPQLFNPRVAFEPVPIEDDEIIQAINNDPNTHDNVWQLKEDINPEALGKFWDEAVRDLKASAKRSKNNK
jgi:hypothetical protein